MEVVITEVQALDTVKKQISQGLKDKIQVSVTINSHRYGIVIDFLIFLDKLRNYLLIVRKINKIQGSSI